MNIRHGLFRIWLVCSIIFIAAVFVVGAPRIYKEFDLAYGPPAPNQLSPELLDKLGIVTEWPDPQPRPWLLTALVSALAIGAPALVFVLGWAYLWAFSGFRKPPEKTG